MNKTLLAILAALGCSTAFAQGTAPITAPKPNVAVAKPTPDVNPFTGKPLSAEQIQRQLEEAKLRTQMLEEELKQVNIEQEKSNVPLRKAVEAAQARTAVRKEEVTVRDIEEAQRAATAARAAEEQARAAKAREAAKEAARKPRSKPAAAAKAGDASTEASADDEAAVVKKQPAPVESAMARRPTLTSVIDVAGSRSAILDFAGGTLVVKDGDMTPFGPLKVLDAQSVNLNGEVYRVHAATLSRFVVSDPKPVDPTGLKSAVTAAPLTAQAPATPVNANGAAPTSPPQRMALPPLQLPPGVSVLPASK